MTKMKSKSRFALLLALALVLATPLVHAQGGPGDPGDDPDPTRAVPFDGGLSLVVAAGSPTPPKKAATNENNKTNKNKQKNKTTKGLQGLNKPSLFSSAPAS